MLDVWCRRVFRCESVSCSAGFGSEILYSLRNLVLLSSAVRGKVWRGNYIHAFRLCRARLMSSSAGQSSAMCGLEFHIHFHNCGSANLCELLFCRVRQIIAEFGSFLRCLARSSYFQIIIKALRITARLLPCIVLQSFARQGVHFHAHDVRCCEVRHGDCIVQLCEAWFGNNF
jgi:hypothetical protein